MSSSERMVIGAMMWSVEAVLDATEVLEADDIYDMRLGDVFSAIVHLYTKGAPVDPMAVSQRLTELGKLEHIGGTVLLSELYGEAAPLGSVTYYAKRIKAESIRRRVRDAGAAIQESAREETEGEVDELVEEAHQLLDRAASVQLSTVKHIGESMDAMVEQLDQPARYLPSPWSLLNGMIDGFRPGALYVVGARPGQGKSIVGLQVAAHLSRWGSVSFASLEMSVQELQQRLLAQVGGVHLSAMSRRAMTPRDWERLAQVLEQVRAMRIYVDDRSGLTAPQVRAHTRSVARKDRLSAVVVDYLQLMQGTDGRRPRHEQVAQMSRDLKVLARDFDVPVIALAQLNRESENERRPPRASDLRESGAIEQDADVVMLLQREWDDQMRVETDNIDVHVVKNRHGIKGKVGLRWEAQFARLGDNPWTPG